MKIFISILLLFLLAIGAGGWYAAILASDQAEHERQAQETEIRILVQKFGLALKNVSLQSPRDALIESMHENYDGVVSPNLLAEWLDNPSVAFGRTVSSPWPERIDIERIERISDSEYRVYGEIIELTSVEQVDGGVAARRPIELTVHTDNRRRFVITGAFAASYDNNQEAMIRGMYVCLPPMQERIARECALGIRADDGSHYALDTSAIPRSFLITIKTGQEVSATGILTPSDDVVSERYNIRGTLRVQYITKI